MRTNVTLFILAWAAAGCGGRGESCEEFQACGGDPIGAWRVSAVCMDADLQALLNESWNEEFDEPACRDAITGVDYALEGTFRFDGSTVEADLSGSVSMGIRFTSACARAYGETLTAGACRKIEESFDGDGSCRYTTDACTCGLTQQHTVVESASYEVDGSTLLIDYEEAAFCVDEQRRELRIEWQDEVSGEPVTGHYVLVRESE